MGKTLNEAGFSRKIIVCALILMISIAAVVIFMSTYAEASSLSKGRVMPAVTLEDWEGKEVTLSPREGRSLYIFYWDEYFGLDYPNIGRSVLNAIYILEEEYKAMGVDFLAVTTNSELKYYIQTMSYDFPVLFDSERILESWFPGYGVAGVGVDEDGIVKGINYFFAESARNAVIKMRQNLSSIFDENFELNDAIPPLMLEGTNMPIFQLQDHEGVLFDNAVMMGNSPVCYIFWHDKCTMAVSTMLRLRNLYAEYNARGVEFIAISYDYTSVLDIKTWLSSNFLPFIHLKDPFAIVAESIGVYGVPTMIVTDANGKIIFSGSGDEIHNSDLGTVLDKVADPPLPGGWPGQPGADPLHNLKPLKEVSGNFDGLIVYSDPLLQEERVARLSAEIRPMLDELYPIFGLDSSALTKVDSTITFYADALRYFNDSLAPCYSIGYCIMHLSDYKIQIYVQWVNDLDTTMVVTRHELIHGLLKLRINQIPPCWFDEGCADAFSRPHLPDYHTVSRYLHQIPSPSQLEIMWSDESLMGDAREIGHAVVTYILHVYEHEGFLSLLDVLSIGKTFEQALIDGLGLTLDQFWAEFWADVPAAKQRSWDAETYICYFDDVDYEAYGSVTDQVNKLAEIGVVDSSGNFLPYEVLTRLQFAELAVRTLGLPNDLLINIQRPNDEITRSEAAVIINLALDLKMSSPPENWTYFADQEQISSWAEVYVWTSIKYSLMDKKLLLVNDKFKNDNSPLYIDQSVTRLEAAVWLVRAYHLRKTMVAPPVVNTLNITIPQEQILNDTKTGEVNANSASEDQSEHQSEDRSWIWYLAGLGFIVILGGAALIIIRSIRR